MRKSENFQKHHSIPLCKFLLVKKTPSEVIIAFMLFDKFGHKWQSCARKSVFIYYSISILSLSVGAISLDVGDHALPQFSVSCSLYQLHFLMFHFSILQPFFHTGHPCHSSPSSTPLPLYPSRHSQIFQPIVFLECLLTKAKQKCYFLII